MATNTLLQRLDTAALTTGSSVGASHRRQVEDFISGAAIAAGDVVMLDTGKTGSDRVLYIKQASAVPTGNPLAIGVALNAAAGAEERVRVVVAGYVEGVNCSAAGATAAGKPLVAGTVAGEVEEANTTDTSGLFGVALEPFGAATNVVAIHIFKRF